MTSRYKWLGLEDTATTGMDRIRYKKEVQKVCRFMVEENMKQEIEKMKTRKMRIMRRDMDADLKITLSMVICIRQEIHGKYYALCLE